MESNEIHSSEQTQDLAQHPEPVAGSQSQAPLIIVDYDCEVRDEINLKYMGGSTAPTPLWLSLRLKPDVLGNSKKKVLW